MSSYNIYNKLAQLQISNISLYVFFFNTYCIKIQKNREGSNKVQAFTAGIR